MFRIRTPLAALAFAVTVAAAVTGLSLRGETRETSLKETCSHAAWPEIPAYCQIGGSGRTVRMVTADHPANGGIGERFVVAFE
jgi:hypothetical protein